uniref:Uncharacterized protein AlNc14C132G6993 n=1 Tax=Albugo laibachii Nc14 TaxID=890382 RepID=F0WKE1_9STRA|nr:conserved hypothetical protein [Albugo laibachii Nc14]|eukprot:CCA21745.1 conserved hypothetical protein [Albugo laibachii Nc14]
MSKKIAQLTKVVFHLNTRNEDYQLEYAFMKESNARTIQQLTANSASKLSDIDQHCQKQLLGLGQQLAESETRYHDLQKSIEKIHTTAKSKQDAMAREFQQHVALIESKLETSQQECMERLSQLTGLGDRQKKVWEQNWTDFTSAMERAHELKVGEMNEKHLEELQEIADRNSVRYDEMCLDLTAQRNRLGERLEAERKAWEFEMTKAKEKMDVAEKMLTEKDQHERNQKSATMEMKQEFVAKMEKLLLDIEELRQQNASLRSENEKLWQQQSELNAALKHAELNCDKLEQERNSVEKDYESKNQNLMRNLNNNALKIESMATEIMNSQKLATEKGGLLKKALEELEKMKLDMTESRMQYANDIVCHQKRILDQGSQCSKLNEQRDQLQQELDRLQAHIRDTTKNYQQVIAKLENETIPTLQQQAVSAQKELENFEQEKRLLDKENSCEREKLQEEITRALARLGQQKTDHQIALETLRTASEQQIANIEVQYSSAQQDALGRLKQQLEEQHVRAIEGMKNSSEDLITQIQKQSGDRNQKQTVQQEALRKECEDAHLATEKLSLQMKQLNDQLKKNETSMDEYKRKFEAATAKEIEYIRKIDQMTLEMDKERLNMKATYTETVKNIEQDFKLRLTAVQAENKGYYEQQLENVIALHEEQRDALRELLKKAQRDHTNTSEMYRESVRSFDERRRMDGEWMATYLLLMKSMMEAKIAEENATNLHRIAVLQQQFTEDLARSDEAKDQAHRAQMEVLSHQSKFEYEELLREHKEALEDQSLTHAQLLQETKQQLEIDRHFELRALHETMNEKWSAFERQACIERDKLLAEKSAAHMKEIEKWQSENGKLCKDFEAKCVELNSANENIVRLENGIAQMRQEMMISTANMKKNADVRIQDVESAAKEELRRTVEENMIETHALNDHFEGTITFMEGKMQELQIQLEEWKAKYINRDSRPEDLERIALLEDSIRHKNMLIRKTLDEMAYFKREMMNREEMYNKTFSKTPNVGLLQVLKPHVSLQQQKAKPEFLGIVSKSHQSSSSANKPRISTNQILSSNAKINVESDSPLWKVESGSLSSEVLSGARSTLPPIT